MFFVINVSAIYMLFTIQISITCPRQDHNYCGCMKITFYLCHLGPIGKLSTYCWKRTLLSEYLYICMKFPTMVGWGVYPRSPPWRLPLILHYLRSRNLILSGLNRMSGLKQLAGLFWKNSLACSRRNTASGCIYLETLSWALGRGQWLDMNCLLCWLLWNYVQFLAKPQSHTEVVGGQLSLIIACWHYNRYIPYC